MAETQVKTTTSLVIEHSFNSSREEVWKAGTEPERIKHWWGPKDFVMTIAKLALHPGGVFHYRLRSPNGQEMWGRFVYGAVEAPERLVFVSSFSDAKGVITRNPMSATWPLEIFNELTLSEKAGKTKLTIRGGPYAATDIERKTFKDAKESIQKGFDGTFSQLDQYLAKASL